MQYRYEGNAYISTDTDTDPIIGEAPLNNFN